MTRASGDSEVLPPKLTTLWEIIAPEAYAFRTNAGTGYKAPRVLPAALVGQGAYLIFASLNSTCLRAIGSYLRKLIFSVWFRGFFFVT